MAGRLRVIAQRLLESKKPKDRRTALIELYGFEPRERDLPDLYWALRQSYPDEPDRGCETRCTLLAILKEIPSPATVKFLQELYPTLPRQRSILESVLVAFTAINSEQALRAMSRVLLQAAMDLGSPMDSWLLLLPVIKDPKNAAAMFPDVLCLLSNRTYRIGLYGVAAVALNAGILKADQLRPMRGRMLGDFREGQRRYAKMKLQGKELAEPVLLLAAIVTVMRAGSDLPEIHKAIRSAVDHDSAYVAFSAYRTCRKLGWEIEPGAIERLRSADADKPLSCQPRILVFVNVYPALPAQQSYRPGLHQLDFVCSMAEVAFDRQPADHVTLGERLLGSPLERELASLSGPFEILEQIQSRRWVSGEPLDRAGLYFPA